MEGHDRLRSEPVSLAEQTTEVREAHRFDVGALAAYLKHNAGGFAGALDVRQFDGGQSNPTFLVESPSGRYVLRKKPTGNLLPSAHQVEREYRVMAALVATDVPVPRMVCLCEDESVIGTAFYVMEFVDGRVFRDPQLPDLGRDERAAVYDDLNRTLARLHSVDYRALGLEDFGKPGNYFARQIGRWSKQYLAAQTEQVESMDRLIDWLPSNVPADDSTTIAHGDFRLENSIYHPSEPRLIAVIDWELSTIGHPLADLAYNCMPYHLMNPSIGGLVGVDFEVTGIPSEREYIDTYCRRTGRSGIESWPFYVAFAIFRLASISQGVYKRALDGNAASSQAATFKNICRLLADMALAKLDEARLI